MMQIAILLDLFELRGNNNFLYSIIFLMKMTVLRARVSCFRCRRPVNKLSTITNKSINGEFRHECSECFRKAKRDPLLAGIEEVKQKKEYYCERCRYRFHSKSGVCPYCSRTDQVIGGKVTVMDLL